MQRPSGSSRPFTGLAPAGPFGAGLPGSRIPTRLAHPERARPRPPHHVAPVPAALAQPPGELDVTRIRFHQLTDPEAIARVLHLRREIQLNVADEASFAALEKKEMRPALSAPSSCMDNSSGQSGWCGWARGWHPAKKSLRQAGWTPRCCRVPGK